MDVENRITVYEKDGSEIPFSSQHLVVRSHWNRSEFAVLVWNGQTITVSCADLKRALDNAANAHR